MLKIESAIKSDQGRRRRNNQDYVNLFEPSDARELRSSGCLYVLADGVGGASRGDRASQYAADKVRFEYFEHPEVEPGERLREAIRHANDDVFSYSQQSERVTRMATTIVVAVIREDTLLVANVGDSRAYLIRNGQAVQVTRDHSIVGEMVANGEMTEEEAMASKIKNKLSRSVGGEGEVHVQVYDPIPLQPGDKIMLCSDGLTRYATRRQVADLMKDGTPAEIVERLVDYANHKGGADNVSVVVAAVGQPSGAQEPTLVAPRPHGPNWDVMETMQTDPEALVRRKGGLLSKPLRISSRRQPLANNVLIGVAVLLLLLVGGGLGAVLASKSMGVSLLQRGALQTVMARGAPPTLAAPNATAASPAASPFTSETEANVPPCSTECTARVTVDPAILRKCPDNTGGCATDRRVSKDDRVVVLQRTEARDWYWVRVANGEMGWLSKDALAVPPEGFNVPVMAGLIPASTEAAVSTEPAGTEPTGTEPAGTEPVSTEPAPDAGPLGVCVIKASGPNGIDFYLSQFGLPRYNGQTQYYSCTVSADGQACQAKNPLSGNPPVLHAGDWLVMPVPGKDACISPGSWIGDASGT